MTPDTLLFEERVNIMQPSQLSEEINRLYDIRNEPGHSPWFRQELDSIYPLILQKELDAQDLYLVVQMFAEFLYIQARTFVERYIQDPRDEIRQVAIKAITWYWKLPEYWQVAVDSLTQDEELLNQFRAASNLAQMKRGTSDLLTLGTLAYVVNDSEQDSEVRFHAYQAMRQIHDTYLAKDMSIDTTDKTDAEIHALIDWDWVHHIIALTPEILSWKTPKEIYERVVTWAKQQQPRLAEVVCRDTAYSLSIFQVENRGKLPRQDLIYCSQFETVFGYFFDDLFKMPLPFPFIFEFISRDHVVKVLAGGIISLEWLQEQTRWQKFLRDYGESIGFADTYKHFMEYDYGPNPRYIGHFAHVMTILRLAITGRRTTPDLYTIMTILGVDRVRHRLEQAQKLIAEGS
jgi:Anticodon binding domain